MLLIEPSGDHRVLDEIERLASAGQAQRGQRSSVSILEIIIRFLLGPLLALELPLDGLLGHERKGLLLHY